MSQVDLHIHTTASDGRLNPPDVVRLAASRGLRVIAITDHDSVAGIAPALDAARNFPRLRVIPGLEMSTNVPKAEIHILGYFVDHHHPELLAILERLRTSREKRAQKMIQKLGGMGIHIKWDRVRELAGDGSVGRPHIARAMLELGCISSFSEAFAQYIGRNGPAYVEQEKLTPGEAIRLITKAGGVAVLAHPANIGRLEEFLTRFKEEGLAGMEVYYDGYPPEVVKQLLMLSHKYELLPCGGSDYHGFGKDNETPLGEAEVPLECAEQLIAMAGAQRWELTQIQ